MTRHLLPILNFCDINGGATLNGIRMLLIAMRQFVFFWACFRSWQFGAAWGYRTSFPFFAHACHGSTSIKTAYSKDSFKKAQVERHRRRSNELLWYSRLYTSY